MLGWLLIVLLVLTGLFYVLTGDGGPAGDLEGAERWAFIAAAVLMGLYAFSLMLGGGRLGENLRHLGLWALIFIGLVAGYSFRGELEAFGTRIAGELMPPGHTISESRSPSGEVSVRLRQRPDGHFVARGEVNGTRLSLLVDTGASTVVLKPADAERAGINVGSLSYSVAVKTANGTSYAAPVRLRTLAVGGIVFEDVEALVAKPGNLSENLLGMSFLRRLRSYEVQGDFLTLRG
ncbi:MAG: TIGR02281 family clan AA aspartic protease [Hyphomicrobiaceae bacterium]|nr:TIGR02281 family clan AA aspartic protease [Hyphomicrobiaceae bacterium]